MLCVVCACLCLFVCLSYNRKYRDDHMMSQFESLSREGRGEEEEEDCTVLVESEDEEIDTGEIRK